MSYETLAQSITTARTLAGTALGLAEQHAGHVTAAREKVAACEAELGVARTRKRQADRALIPVRRARQASALQEVVTALEAAEAEVAAATSILGAADSACTAARQELEQALTPIQVFVDLDVGTKRVGSLVRREQLNVAERLVSQAAQAVEVAKAWYPAIAAFAQRQQAAEQAAVAHRSMEEAFAQLPSTANKAAKVATRRNSTGAAAAAAVRSQEFLVALSAIELFTQLQEALAAVLREARQVEDGIAAREYQQAQVRRAEESSRYTADDGCTCTETTRCHWCYQQQNDAATGQGRFAPERGPAD